MGMLRLTISLFCGLTLSGQTVSRTGLSRALGVDAQGRLDYCVDAPVESSFTAWDEIVVVRYQVSGGRAGDVWRIEWVPTEGTPVIYRPQPPASPYGGCYAWVLGVLDPRVPRGNWEARVILNGTVVARYPFILAEAPASPLNYSIAKIPEYVPSNVDMIPYGIHNGGQIAIATNQPGSSNLLTPFGALVGSPQLATGLPGTNPVVSGIDVREGILLGSTTNGNLRSGFRKGNETLLLSYPGATATEIRGAWVLGNRAVGKFVDSRGVDHGFVYSGAFNLHEPAGAVSSEANGVNSLGAIAGSYIDAAGVRRGYVWNRGTFAPLDIPGAKSTRPWGINDGGQVAGSFIDANGVEHGFVWNAGAFRQLDVPGAESTAASGINGSGQVVGTYREAGKPLRGFAAYLPTRPLQFCNYALEGLETPFDAAGGSRSIRLVTEPGCRWTLFSLAPWLRALNSIGAGPATVLLIASPNTGVARQGDLYLGGKTVPVSQRGAIAALPVITGVVHGASFTPGIAAGGWFVIAGTGLSTTTRPWGAADFSGTRLPLRLDGVSVKVAGVDAYPYFVSPEQLNVLAPSSIAEGPAAVEVTGPNGTTRFTAAVLKADPGIFLIGPIRNGRAPASAVHADGTLVGEEGAIAGAVTRPASAGDAIVLYGTGFGAAASPIADGTVVSGAIPLASTPDVFVGGKRAQADFAGYVGAGLAQVNIRVPDGLPAGKHFVLAVIGGKSSTAVAAIDVK